MLKKNKPVPIAFEDVRLDCAYRLDLLVENRLVLELKSVVALHDVHLSQILTYMKLGKYKSGLLINFNVYSLKEGIKRVVNSH